MIRITRVVFQVFLLAAVVMGFLGTAGVRYAQGLGTSGIAYTPASARNEIRMINQDGSGDRQLWSTGKPSFNGVDGIRSMSWRPDGGTLVISSTHEAICSLNYADVFTINADGTGYRRVTEAPACAALATFPQGQVLVPVLNNSSESFTGFVYFQGASSAQVVNLPPGGSTTVTFPSVADFGVGELQTGAFFQGPLRNISIAIAVDVIAGGSVTTAQLVVFNLSDFNFWETHSSTARRDGQRIAYVLNFNNVRGISPNAAALDFGEPLLATPQSSLPDFVSWLAYGPTAATANQLLYVGSNAFDSLSVYLVTEGSATPGTPIMTHDSVDLIYGLAWLPDGSGFVYSVRETTFDPTYTVSSNLFLYTFATQKATRVTNFQGEFTGQLSVSPDGQQIVFERGAIVNLNQEVVDSDLWIINRNGSGLRLLKAGAFAPAWSPGTSSTITYNNHVFLPLMHR